jgi:hypothetical protein
MGNKVQGENGRRRRNLLRQRWRRQFACCQAGNKVGRKAGVPNRNTTILKDAILLAAECMGLPNVVRNEKGETEYNKTLTASRVASGQLVGLPAPFFCGFGGTEMGRSKRQTVETTRDSREAVTFACRNGRVDGACAETG